MLYESVVKSGSTITDYLIRSAVLGTVLTKLDASGNKDTTYVPANGLVAPMQQPSFGSQYISWAHRDALGVQENSQAYDPFGNLIYNVQPPNSGPPPYHPFYGATYGGASWNSFSLANNLAAGCNYLGTPMDCSSAMIKTMGLEFASNLPGFYLDNAYAEQGYNNYVRDASVRKPKGPPTLKPAQKRSKSETVRLRNENAWVGDDEGDLQEPVLNNPASLPAEGEGKGSNCDLSVSFQLGTSYEGDPNMANGPTIIKYGGKDQAGLGFTVSGSVSGGGSIEPDFNPNGWALEQHRANYERFNGRERLVENRALQEPISVAPHNITGNTFSWWDHPGVYTSGLSSYYRKINFAVKVMNGRDQCEIKFAILMTFNNASWSIGWGRGNFSK